MTPHDSRLTRGSILNGSAGQYIVTREIGRGGVGAVYLGKSIASGQQIALKVLHGGRFEISDASKLRFQTEIKNSCQLSHPNLVQTLDYGVYNGIDFSVLEYLSGGTIAQRIGRKDYEQNMALSWIVQMIKGVQSLHHAGFVHRDLKPNNMLLDNQEVLKIADFGILKDLGEEAYLTLSGDQIGSVLYISPSQRKDPEHASAIDDYYAICCCIYEVLSQSRIHVAPVHLLKCCVFDIPDYVSEVVMDGILSGSNEDTLQHLLECFTESPDGVVSISDFARSNVLRLSSPVRSSDVSLSNAKRRFALNVPVKVARGFSFEEGFNYKVVFWNNTKLIVLASYVTPKRSSGFVVNLSGDILQLAYQFETAFENPIGSLNKISDGRFAIFHENGLTMIQAHDNSASLETHPIDIPQNGVSSVAKLPDADEFVLLTSGRPLKIITIEKEVTVREICGYVAHSSAIPRIAVISQTGLLLSESKERTKFASYILHGDNIELCHEVDVEDEIMDTAKASQDEVVVGTVDGIFKLSFPSLSLIWQMPRPSKLAMNITVSPDNNYIAAIFGAFSG